MGSPAARIDSLLSENKALVFSKSYCPYCKATKELFAGLDVKPTIIELDQVDGGAAIQDKLEEITGQRSVPNIFLPKFGAPDYSVQTKAVEGHEGMFHVGGNSEAQGVKKELGKWAPAYTASIKA